MKINFKTPELLNAVDLQLERTQFYPLVKFHVLKPLISFNKYFPHSINTVYEIALIKFS